jgi:hypothetical protein
MTTPPPAGLEGPRRLANILFARRRFVVALGRLELGPALIHSFAPDGGAFSIPACPTGTRKTSPRHHQNA